ARLGQITIVGRQVPAYLEQWAAGFINFKPPDFVAEVAGIEGKQGAGTPMVGSAWTDPIGLAQDSGRTSVVVVAGGFYDLDPKLDALGRAEQREAAIFGALGLANCSEVEALPCGMSRDLDEDACVRGEGVFVEIEFGVKNW